MPRWDEVEEMRFEKRVGTEVRGSAETVWKI
jgi:hypothetical protein